MTGVCVYVCNTLQHTATHCNTLQHTEVQRSTHTTARGRGERLVCVCMSAAHCNTLQHTATHCNALQHTATHCNTLQHTEAQRSTHTTARGRGE